MLVTHETTPDDIKGMNAAVGILTKTGGATCHAAVVARAMDKACVVGCTEIEMYKLQTANKVTIDGTTGRVWIDAEVPVIDSSDAPELKFFMDWAMQAAQLSETVTLDKEGFTPQTICASHWWGNKDIFNSVLDNLAKLPSRSHVTLDLHRPEAFEKQTMLHGVFGFCPTDGPFLAYMVEKLELRKDELAGLQITGHKFGSPATDAYQFSSVVSAPADYAMYCQLGV